MAQFHAYESRSQVARWLAEDIAQRLRTAIDARGRASLVVCGGSSPGELFEHLASQALDWSKVTVLPSDERWVPTDDSQSNERLIRETLLVAPAAQARFVGLYRPVANPGQALDDVAHSLATIPRPLDVVLLGMGSDGHTASLFPQAADIRECLESSADCVAPDVGPTARISLGLAMLTRARSIDLLIFGQEKKQVFEQAQKPGDVADLPVRAILQLEEPVAQVHWAE